MKDPIFDYLNFALNASAFFGILPGLLLKVAGPKKTVAIGGTLVVLAQIAAINFVNSEKELIKTNSRWGVFAIAVCLG